MNGYSAIHIEFYGLPGAGKTTISEEVCYELKQNGYEIIQASKIENLKFGCFRKLLKAGRLFFFCLLHPYICKKIIITIKENFFSTWIEKIKFFVSVIQKIIFYYKKGVFIWDEGVVQLSVSMAITGKKNSIQNLNNLITLCPDTVCQIRVYIVTNIDEALQRMNFRMMHHSRVEKERSKIKKNLLLKRFEEECNRIESECIVRNTNYDNEKISREIVNFLMESHFLNK